MKPGTAVILRLVGPLIELPCAMGMVRYWGRGASVAGVPAEALFGVGLAVGLGMVVAGLTMARRVRPSRPPAEDGG